MGWLALINYLLEADDRAERYFLEAKSEVNLSSRRDQAKVAKFILGAANRDKDLALRRFGGHALMVLGVGHGEVIGVPAFEAKDLAVTVQRLIGADGPRWDFERIKIADKDVIVVIVDPPSGEVWTCRADGDGLIDGTIYVRADGETRRATGDEIRSLIERAKKQPNLADVDVAVAGDVLALHIDEAVFADWIPQEAKRLRDMADADTRDKSYGIALPSVSVNDTCSRGEFLAEVAEWEKAVWPIRRPVWSS